MPCVGSRMGVVGGGGGGVDCNVFVFGQGTTLRLALLPGASSAVKNRVSGKFMA